MRTQRLALLTMYFRQAPFFHVSVHSTSSHSKRTILDVHDRTQTSDRKHKSRSMAQSARGSTKPQKMIQTLPTEVTLARQYQD